MSLYDIAEEIKKGRVIVNHKTEVTEVTKLQDSLSLCNKRNNSVTSNVTVRLQGGYTNQNPEPGPPKDDNLPSHPSHPSQSDLSLCNNSHNLRDTHGTEGVPDCPVLSRDQVVPCQGAELISSSLQYLAGITEDLSGWKLWRRIEQGKEHRFATDQAGVIRWGRTYLVETDLFLIA